MLTKDDGLFLSPLWNSSTMVAACWKLLLLCPMIGLPPLSHFYLSHPFVLLLANTFYPYSSIFLLFFISIAINIFFPSKVTFMKSLKRTQLIWMSSWQIQKSLNVALLIGWINCSVLQAYWIHWSIPQRLTMGNSLYT